MVKRFHALVWFVCVGLLATLGPSVFATQQPKTRQIPYDQWGFSVAVPFTSIKESVPSEGVAEVWDVFRFGELVYMVQVIKTPPETLTATAIEQAIQAHEKAAASLGGTKRWELTTPGGVFFKGLSGPLPRDENSPDAFALKMSLGSKQAHRCLGMAAIGGDISPIVCLSVIGPEKRAAEIDDLGKFFAYEFVKMIDAAAKPSSDTRPSPSAKKPSPPKLKKGDIELVGRVEFVDSISKRLSMVVDRIRLPNTDYITLDPPRRKIVRYKTPLPKGITVDARITVIGHNTGVGKPMTASYLNLESPSEGE